MGTDPFLQELTNLYNIIRINRKKTVINYSTDLRVLILKVSKKFIQQHNKIKVKLLLNFSTQKEHQNTRTAVKWLTICPNIYIIKGLQMKMISNYLIYNNYV